jgi:hypothetical protein
MRIFMEQIELLIIPFYIIYLIEAIFKGYKNISFEKEAYRKEQDFDYLKRRKYLQCGEKQFITLK